MLFRFSPRARLCAALSLLALISPTLAYAESEQPKFLDPVSLAPDRLLAVPPAPGSIEERAEFAEVRMIGQLASAERIASARHDGEHEDLTVFADAAGRELTSLPATAHLLGEVADEAEAFAVIAKARFARARPYATEPALARCGDGKAPKKSSPRSYPSGHATFAWSTAWTLAALLPDRAPQFFTRAAEFGFSREICGVHFPSDIEAGHILGVVVASALLADPRLAPDIAAARAELAHN